MVGSNHKLRLQYPLAGLYLYNALRATRHRGQQSLLQYPLAGLYLYNQIYLSGSVGARNNLQYPLAGLYLYNDAFTPIALTIEESCSTL